MLALLYLVLHLAAAYASASKGKTIIILAGQSNMSGRGGVINNTWDGVVPLQSQPNPSILRLTANLTWVEAHEPLHKDIDVQATCGVGPGMAFANRVLQKDPRLGPLGLVPCAVGGPMGTKISDWGRRRFLYKQLLRRAEVARRDGGSVRGVLWFQGESDTVSEVDARKYKRRLVNLFNSLRADLGSPLLPIVHVAITSGQGPLVDTVRKAQLGIKLPKVRCVDAKGLPLLQDNLHLSTAGELHLGQMLGDAFLIEEHPTKQQYLKPQLVITNKLHQFLLLKPLLLNQILPDGLNRRLFSFNRHVTSFLLVMAQGFLYPPPGYYRNGRLDRIDQGFLRKPFQIRVSSCQTPETKNWKYILLILHAGSRANLTAKLHTLF